MEQAIYCSLDFAIFLAGHLAFPESMDSTVSDGRSLEQYQERIRRIEDQTLESSRRSVRTLEETVQIGAETMVELDEQGEKLNRAERRLDDIDQDLRTSQRTMREIRSVFGGVVNWFTKDKLSTTPSSVTQENAEARKAEASARRHEQQQQRQRQERQQQQQRHQQRRPPQSAREEELDQNLDRMSQSLAVLRNMGEDMGDSLEAQNEQIGRMSGRVLTLDDKTRDLRDQGRRVLRS